MQISLHGNTKTKCEIWGNLQISLRKNIFQDSSKIALDFLLNFVRNSLKLKVISKEILKKREVIKPLVNILYLVRRFFFFNK